VLIEPFKKNLKILMALLVFSDKCQYSFEIINFIKANPALGQMIRFHNVTTHGRPTNQNIKRVPTLVTSEGNILVGAEVKNWLESMIPNEIEHWAPSGVLASSLDDGDGGPDMFKLESYGMSMQPMLTPELKAKISQDVKNATYST
jgi:hypothetical protein